MTLRFDQGLLHNVPRAFEVLSSTYVCAVSHSHAPRSGHRISHCRFDVPCACVNGWRDGSKSPALMHRERRLMREVIERYTGPSMAPLQWGKIKFNSDKRMREKSECDLLLYLLSIFSGKRRKSIIKHRSCSQCWFLQWKMHCLAFFVLSFYTY
jgi:hypothetical protein